MVRLALSLLGPFEATRNGTPVSWSGGDATRALLAYLALHAGTELRRGALAGLLWPDVPQAAALANLRQALHRLRVTIGDSEADPACLHVTRRAITCSPPIAKERPKDDSPGSDPAFWLDVAAFRAALDAVAAHAHRPQALCVSCVRRVEEALVLYRGEFLAGFSYPSDLYEGWMVVEREALHAQALEALALLADDYAARGQHADALRAARRQIELEPWREGAHRQGMRALAASGQRGAALAQYEACRRVLEEELGVEPEPETTALYERIRSGALSPVRSGSPAGPGALGSLPIPPTPFIGRQAQVTQAIDALAGASAPAGDSVVRLLTLTGAGGTGKTRLALEIGARLRPDYPDGVYFVSLAPLRDPAYVVPAIARVLGVRETKGQSLIESLEYTMRDRRLLLILDNAEHLLGQHLPTAASVVSQLLAAAPTLKVLVTSRAPLRLYGEHEYHVPPMEVPAPRALPSLDRLAQAEAVQLFVQRARAVRPGFALGEGNVEAVAEICARLDGLPLAIELAAARIKLFSPQAILSRLDERLQFLTGGPRDLPERQRTLRATIDWSVDLLTTDERTLLRRLAVFAGGCTLPAIEAVLLEPTSAGPADDLVGSLVDQSLLETAQAADEPRFVMLETVRAYAAERLEESGEAEAVRRRHAAFYLDLAKEAEPALHRYGVEQAAWMERLEREQDNLHAALGWALSGADVELGLRLAVSLGRFWEIGLWHDQGRAWLARALEASSDCAAEENVKWVPLRAAAFNWAGTLAMYSDPGAAAALQQEGLALWQETGDTRGIGYTLCELGMAEDMLGDLETAEARMLAGIVMLRQAQDTLSLARALYWYARIPLSRGDYERVRALANESAQLSRQIGALAHTATTIRVLGHVAEAEGDLEAARSAYEEDLRLARQARDRLCIEQCLAELGRVAYAQDDVAGAIGYWQEALELFRSSGDKLSTTRILLALSIVSRYQGNDQRAEQLGDEGLALARELPDAQRLVQALHARGQLALAQGNRTYAVRLFAEGLHIIQENRLADMVPAFLADLAAVEVDPVRAVRLFGAAQALLDAAGSDHVGAVQAAYERALAAARAGLSEQAFARAWAEGREMAVSGGEPAVAYALGRAGDK